MTLARLLAWLFPGLLCCLGGLWWASTLSPRTSSIPVWNGVWTEIGQPPGIFRCWRIADSIQGESQPYPPDHPRATTMLQGPIRPVNDGYVVAATILELVAREFFVEFPVDASQTEVIRIGLGGSDQGVINRAFVSANGRESDPLLATKPFELAKLLPCELQFVRRGSLFELAVAGRIVVQANHPDAKTGGPRVGLRAGKIRLSELSVRTTPSD